MVNKKSTIFSNIIFWLVIIFLYFPVLLLAFYSFTDASMLGQSKHFSLDNYVTLFTESTLTSMMISTLVLAMVVSVISTLLGTVGAVSVYYSGNKVKSFVDFTNQIPVVNADVVTGFSVCILLIVFCHMDKATCIPLVLALTTLCTPFVYLSVYPRLLQMDDALFEAALDLGCNKKQAFFKVVIPQISGGIINGFLTAVTLSLDDYFITTYTKPASFDTISTYVVNATRGAQTEIKTALWALSTVIFLFVIAFVVFTNMGDRHEMLE